MCTDYEKGRAGAELWVERHQAQLRMGVDKIARWREAIRGNRMLKDSLPPPFYSAAGRRNLIDGTLPMERPGDDRER